MATRARRGDPRGDGLLEIATAHVRRFGAARTTVVAVAQEAGMTHANVYRYFPSKEALVDAVVADWMKAVEKGLTGVADGPDPADDKLERLILAYARALRAARDDDPNVAALHVLALNKERLVARRHRQRVRTLIERTIEEGMSADLFRVHSRERATTFVLDVLHRFIDPRALASEAEAAEDERIARVIRAILRSLAAGVV